MEVALCISGSLREFKHCWDNINKNVVQQFERCDIFLKSWKRIEDVTQWHGNSKDNISEPDTCTPEEAIELIHPVSYSIEIFDKQKESEFDLYPQRYKLLHHDNNQKNRVINCLAMYYNIFYCNEIRKNRNYDYVIRMRPDLIFAQPFTESILKRIESEDEIGIPYDYNFIGTNDQLAWGRPETMNKYSACYYNIPNLYDKGCSFHPESFLKAHLKDVGLKEIHQDVRYIIKRPYEQNK